MKVTSLHIDEYKLLKDFDIHFNKDISILIGVNGSGKSTILECIAQIFSDAFLKEKAKFGFRLTYELRLEEILGQTSMTSEFKTEYFAVEISGKKGEQLTFKIGDTVVKENEIIKRYGSFERILPSNIVIYYSGLSDIMKGICEPHDDILSKQFREGNTNAVRPFFYFEPALFNLVLLSLLSYQYGDIPKFLYERAKIEGVQSIRINLKKPTWGKGKIDTWWGAKGEVKALLDYLDSIGQPLKIDENNKSNGNVVIQAWENDALIIDIIGQQKLFEIREYFVEEKTLFKVLNTLLIDGFDPKVRITFLQDDNEGKRFFNVLSEGEQQSIIIRGLVELVNNENTLFLFDEPDTYLHPLWQRNFIEDVSQFTTIDELTTSQFLITTHSPQLLGNADPTNCDVQIMEDGEIVKITPKHYGRDISSILYEMMGVESRNKSVAKSLSILFNHIEDEDLEKSKVEYAKLAELIGEDEPIIIRAKTQLDYLQEAHNEANH